MKRLKAEFAILAVLIGVFLGRIPDTVAKHVGWEAFFDTMVDVRAELVRHFVTEPDEQEMLEGAIGGMIETLKDPYTVYMTPEDLKGFDKQTRATFFGIGAQIDLQDGQIIIVSPLEDSPAFKAGILAGDAILEINGESTKGMTSLQAVEKITGPKDTEVKLLIRHPDGQEQTIAIIRQEIKIQTVKGFLRDREHHWQYMLDAERGIGYVRMTQFSQPSAGALREAIEQMKGQGLKGLIFDLRYNPGGLLDAAIEVSDMFLAEGRIVSTKGRNSPERQWSAQAGHDYTDFPLVVLVNEFSASASEIVAGALKDNNRAVILGERTFGKGSVQQVLGLEGGNGAIKVTTAHYYLPSGRNLHKHEDSTTWGVDPNDGFYLSMSFDEMEKMAKVRRESEIIRDENAPAPAKPQANENGGNGQADADAAPAQPVISLIEDAPKPMTGQWLRDVWADKQLAAAYEAIVTKLETGEYKGGEKSNATLLAHLHEKEKLQRQRDALLEGVEKINEKIAEVDKLLAAENGEEKK